MCEVDCERGWKEELQRRWKFTVVTITTLRFHTDVTCCPTQMHLLAEIQREREDTFPETAHAGWRLSPLVFAVVLARSPVYVSPQDNDGPRKSRVSLCRPSCPASVFRMSSHNIIICTSVCCFACITRCFCVLVVRQ